MHLFDASHKGVKVDVSPQPAELLVDLVALRACAHAVRRADLYKNKKPPWERTGPSPSIAEATPLSPGAKAVDGSVAQNGNRVKAERRRGWWCGVRAIAPQAMRVAVCACESAPEGRFRPCAQCSAVGLKSPPFSSCLQNSCNFVEVKVCLARGLQKGMR